jgi:hypothetical protein
VVWSAQRTGHIFPQGRFLVYIFFTDIRPHGQVLPEVLSKENFSAPSGIEPATFRLAGGPPTILTSFMHFLVSLKNVSGQ